MECHLLSDHDYTQLLQRLYKTTEVQFVRAHLEPISANVEGFLGEHNNLHVTLKRGDVTTTEVLFLKSKPQNNKLQANVSNELSAYEKEIFLYDYLVKQFEKYGCAVNFAPKCHYVVRGEALILENLCRKGFTINDRYTRFNMAQIECALRALAAFHGAGIVHDLKKTTELQRPYSMAEEFPAIFEETLYIMELNPNGFAMKCWRGSFKTFRSIIDLMAGDGAFKERFTSMVFKFKFGACFAQPTKYLKTCGHGDLWSNNMMFKYENGRPVECRLLDFQICRFFYPAFDVVLMIYANTAPSFRREHIQKLYGFYYECLGDILAEQGYQLGDLMSFDDFLDTVKLVLRDAMLQILGAVLVVNLSKELLNLYLDLGNTEKLEEFMFDNANICADAFKKDEKYRNIITEAFQEYYDILLSYK